MLNKKSQKVKRVKLENNQGVSYLMMSPFLIAFLIFTIIPVVVSAAFCFTSFDLLNMPKFVFLDNFTRLFFNDDIFMIALRNTLIMAVLCGPMGYVSSFIIAWAINEFKSPIKQILTFCFYAPSLAGSIMFIWHLVFSGDSYGILNSLLLELGFIDSPVQWLTNTNYNFTICIIVQLWMSMGTGFLTFLAGLQAANPEIAEAGAIDGIKNRWQELWYITLPQMKPQLLYGAVFAISNSFGMGAVNSELTGNPSTDYSTHTLVLHMHDYSGTRYEVGYAAAISMVLFVMMLLYWYIFNKVLARWNTD